MCACVCVCVEVCMHKCVDGKYAGQESDAHISNNAVIYYTQLRLKKNIKF